MPVLNSISNFMDDQKSISNAWSTIDEFRTLNNPDKSDVVELDIAMMIVLRSLDTESAAAEAGHSKRFPRYQQKYPDRTPKEELRILRQHYSARHRDLQNLERVIERRQIEIERTCDHEWEMDLSARDHRSRYDCKKCGAYR